MVKKIVWAINIIILVLVVVFLLDVLGYIGKEHTIEIEIGKNDNLTTIAETLQKNGVVVNSYLFKFYYQINAPKTTVTPGTISVNGKMRYSDIMRVIRQPETSEIEVTIPEGFEVREIATRLMNNELIKNEEVFYAALKEYSFENADNKSISGNQYELSGYLYPDTYRFYKTSKPKEIIETLINNYKKVWTDEYTARAKELDLSVNEVMTLASIIEREARNKEDFPKVSSVFHNRLKINQKLESCATVQYILKERKPILSVEDTKIDSPFNTYKNPGLPPAPICSPGALAIKSALYPDKTNYLFFFTDKKGINHYTITFDEHNAAIKKFGL